MYAYLFLCHHSKYSYGELPQVYSHEALVLFTPILLGFGVVDATPLLAPVYRPSQGP
jgi:hypothetical protein